MTDQAGTIVALLESWLGGALTTLVAAALGRLMFHVGEVRKGRRRILGFDLVGEMPIIAGMAIIAEGLVSYLEAASTVSAAIVAATAYLGPRGVEVMLTNWISRKGK